MRWRPLVLGAVSSLMACAVQSAPAGQQAQTATLDGSGTSGVRVLIESVDSGPRLYVSRGTLGTKVSIVPGHHTVNVMCEFTGSKFLLLPGEVIIDVQAGHVYQLVGTLAEHPKRCNVAAFSRA